MIEELDNPFYRSVQKRIYSKKQNALILIVGDPGTGKSLVALKIANKLDPTFTHENIRERVVIQPEQFSQLIAEEGKDKLPPGSAIIIDEAGAAAMSSRDWYSIGNKMISYILQTFRYRRLILIMTVPNMSFIDVHARKLVNFLVETKKIDFGTSKTKARVWKLKFNKVSGDADPYRIRFRKRDEFGELVIIDCIWFSRVDCKIVHSYEKYADEFKQRIAEKALKNITKVKEDTKKQEFDAKEIAALIMKERDKYFGSNGKPDKGRIEVDFKIGSKRVIQVISMLKAINSDNESPPPMPIQYTNR